MGTWGVGAFDNDDAADWSLEFENADLAVGLRLIADALSVAAQAGDDAYLDQRDGVRGSRRGRTGGLDQWPAS